MTKTTEGPETLEAPVKHVRTDKSAPKVKQPKTEKETKKVTPKKPPVWVVHYGHVVEHEGNRVYRIEPFEHDSMADALKELNALATKHAGNGIRELILSFPKVKKAVAK